MEGTTNTAPTQDPATDPSAPQPAPTPEPKRVEMNLEAFNDRLAKERTAGEKALLKALGVEKAEDAKALLDLAKKTQEASLTEKQQLEKQIADLSPKAQKAESLEKLVADMVTAQFEALPDAAKSAIDKVASGDPQERLRMMNVMRDAGLLNPAPPKAPAPANTAPAGAPPKPAPARTKWDEYQDFQKRSPTQAAVFYQSHRAEIERTRPAPGQ